MPASTTLAYSINQAKDLFLTAAPIEAAINKARIPILKRAGGTVRRIARSSIRKTKWHRVKRGEKPSGDKYFHEYLNLKAKASVQNQPPKTHSDSGEFGIKSIFFAYEARSDSVVIGPIGRPSAHSVPEALEKGGVSVTRVPKWARSRVGGKSRIRKRIKKRPFMMPALVKFQKEYPNLWRNAVKPTASKAA